MVVFVYLTVQDRIQSCNNLLIAPIDPLHHNVTSHSGKLHVCNSRLLDINDNWFILYLGFACQPPPNSTYGLVILHHPPPTSPPPSWHLKNWIEKWPVVVENGSNGN